MFHDDLFIGNSFECVFLGNVSVLAVELKIVGGLVGGLAVDGLPFHEPNFLALRHHIVELVHLFQLYDLRDVQEGTDCYVVVVTHFV